MKRHALLSTAAAVALLLAAALSTAYAEGNGPGGKEPPGQFKKWAETPELDSVLLFGSGTMALAGYLIVRRRAAK